MSKPTNLAEWGTSGSAVIAEPLLAEKQLGWGVAKKPPAQWMNWWMKQVYLWIVWLDAFESTAHSWSALQTFTAGILASSFGASPGTPGIRGTNAVAGTSDVDGSGHASAIKGSTSVISSAGIFGESTHAQAYGGSFKNVQPNAAATGAQGLGAGTGLRGRGSYYAGVYGVIDDSMGTPQTNAGGVVGNSYVDGLPGVRGEGVFADAIGGFFLGYNPVDESASGGSLALKARGGDSPILFYDDGTGNSEDYPAGDGLWVEAGDGRGDGTANTGYNAGTNALFGGDVYGSENDLGQPGAGLELYGGDVIGTGVANGRRGGTGLKVFGGASDAGQGYSLEADGDAVFYDLIKLDGSNLAANVAQTNQISPGLAPKAWAKVSVATSKAITLMAGQNVAAVGKTGTGNMLYVDLAAPVPRDARSVTVSVEDRNVGAVSTVSYFAAPVARINSNVTDTRICFTCVKRDATGAATDFDFSNPPVNLEFNIHVDGEQ